MKRHPAINRPIPRPKRLRGFTLLELLVVIGLIIFLVSATVGVVSGVIGGAREKGTKATIRKIDGMLSQRMEDFTMWLQAHDKTKDKNTPDYVKSKKDEFRRRFPQNLVEANLAAATYTDPDPATISSEAMYEFITNGEMFLAPPIDSDAFSTNEVADTDGDSRMEFIDAWGKPLRFYRWPTRLIRPAPSGQEADSQSYDTGATPPGYKFGVNTNYGQPGHDATLFFGSLPSELNKDPDDPLVLINHQSVNVATFESQYHTPETWSLPLVVSAGPDGILGLYEPTDKTNFGHLAQPNATEIGGILDNLSNRNLQP